MKSENDFGGFPSIEEYLDDLWWFMFNSNDPDRKVWAFGCYLDESGTHDASPYTVVAGLLLNRNNFISLGVEWRDLLQRMRIKTDIHMKEFGKHGKLGYLTEAERYFLFTNISGIINSHKIYSVAGVIDQQQYKEILNLDKRKEMSPYGFCFIMCAYANHIEAKNNNRQHDIGYLMSEVSEHRGQILETHAEMRKEQEEGLMPLHIGRIGFDYPKYVPALQAADIIAWGVRRRLIGDHFDQGFEYVQHIISDKHHVQHSWDEPDLRALAQKFMKYKEQKTNL
ncbi:MAG: DUF3800 domain-containing protein [Dehalococcoidia bacterium]